MKLTAITDEDIGDIADSQAILERGRDYYRKGRIKSLQLMDDRILAFVYGNYGTYKVEIWIEDGELEAECNCPYDGYGCKHIAAVLFKWVDGMQLHCNSSSKKMGGRPFLNNLKFEEFASSATTESQLKAFDYVNNKQVSIRFHGANKIVAEIGGEGKKKHVVSIEDSEGFWGGKRFECECSCNGNRFGKNCAHASAVLLEILKNKKTEEISKGYEKIVRSKLQKEKFEALENELQESILPKEATIKRRYALSLGIERESDEICIRLKKAILLKTGSLGKQTMVSRGFLKEELARVGNKKRALSLMINEAHDDYYHDYSNNGSVVKKGRLDSAADLELLGALRELYQNEPDFFENCCFPKEKALPQICFEEIADKKNSFLFNLTARLNGSTFNLKNEETTVFGNDPLWAFTENKQSQELDGTPMCFELQTSKPSLLKKLLQHSGTEINESKMSNFIEKYYAGLCGIGPVTLPEKFRIIELNEALPKPRLFLNNYKKGFSIELRFLYLNNEVACNDTQDIVFRDNDKFAKIRRNRDAEKELFGILLENNTIEKNGILLPSIEPLDWLTETAAVLIKKGFEIYGQDSLVNYRINPAEPNLTVEVSSGIDWFDLKADADFGVEKIAFNKVIGAINKNERFIKLSDGSLGIIPKKWISKLEGVSGFLQKSEDNGQLRAANSQIEIVEALLETANKARTDQNFDRIRKKFKNFRGIKKTALPKKLKAELRDYQKVGYNWLYFLKEFSFGGCLADEMGLGKTVQALALLLKEQEKGNKVPSLVVAPRSLLFNWEQEVNKFTPSLKVYRHHGQDRSRVVRKIDSKKADLVITTYATLRNDLDLFKEKQFHYIILDESQQIKNPLSKSTKSIYKLKARHRLVLTGTPIENNTLDLWSQFAFLNPGLLGSMDYFKRAFVKSIDKEGNKDKARALKNIINPFMLIRKKEMVAKELPDKQMTITYCEMERKQREVYENCKAKFKEEISEAIREKGFMRSKLKILEGLMRLRQICNHPRLFDESFTGESGKFNILISQIEEVIEEGHKVLIFSSFVKMLHIFREYFTNKGIKFCYLDGKTIKRKQEIEKFQQDRETKIFLMSLKAGGLGLNLTAADYVFIVDPWWNPAAEMQAIDRTHRIGQKNKVFIYKAIMKDSVEEKILELQEKKVDLVKNVITAEKSIFKNLDKKDIEGLFR